MQSNDWLCFCLMVMNVVQFIYWMREVQRLVDKIMSRNYSEYVQAQSLTKPLPVSFNTPSEDDGDEQSILDELNGKLAR